MASRFTSHYRNMVQNANISERYRVVGFQLFLFREKVNYSVVPLLARIFIIFGGEVTVQIMVEALLRHEADEKICDQSRRRSLLGCYIKASKQRMNREDWNYARFGY